MNTGVISVRYARALLKSACEQGLEDKVYAIMQTLAQSYLQVPKLRMTIESPMLPKEKKRKLLEVACGENCPELIGNFLSLVMKADREELLQLMANDYVGLYRKQKNIIRGKVITASPVSSQTEDKMKALVQSRAQGTVEFNTEVDPSLIGGFILEYDTYRMDASVKSKLNAILTQLKK
ncbi:F0F1 ATP synthase subunit delta [Prevotella fusca]